MLGFHVLGLGAIRHGKIILRNGEVVVQRS
jgi:hypothetical protein